MHHMVQLFYDVRTAYMAASLLESERVPLRYPVEQREYRDGKELYAVVSSGLYGLPQSGRRWSEHLDKWLLATFSSNGWTVSQMRYEPC